MTKKSSVWSLVGVGAVVVTGVTFLACSEKSSAVPKTNFVYKAAPKPGVVAKIAGEDITDESLMGDDKMDFFELKKREYDLKMDRVNKLVVDKMIGAEAKKAGLGLDDFINKKVVGGDVKISDAEFNKFVKDRKIPENQMNPQLKERIMSYLQQTKRQEKVQDYVAKITKSNPVELYFTRPKYLVPVDSGAGPSMGKADAAVQIVEFSDFQCPFCSRGADTVNDIKKKYGNKVRITFRHFPLPMHKEAKPASEASMCMNEQSSDKFWKFHDAAFKNQDKLDDAGLEKLAKESGGDVKKFLECYKGKKYAQAVQDDMTYGEKLGVRSTPTFFINGEMIAGALPIEQFSEIIDEALEKKK